MATPLISHPFRVTPAGAVATHEDGTEEYYAERLALLILTQPGERPLVPSFGLRDPSYAVFDDAALSSQLDLFGPPVQLTDVTSTPITDTLTQVTVEFDLTGDQEVGGNE